MATPIIYSLEGNQSGLPLTDNSGIRYEIRWDKKTKWAPGANLTSATCRVFDDEAFDWVTDMVGQAFAEPRGGVMSLSRIVPQRNPEIGVETNGQQWCTWIEQIDQYGTADEDAPADFLTGWPVLTFSTHRATFESLPYRVFPDSFLYDQTTGNATLSPLTGVELNRYVVRRRKSYSKEVTFSGDQFIIIGSSPPQRIMQTAFRVMIFADMVYTLYRYPVDLLKPVELDAMEGKVNSIVFDDSPYGGYSCGNGTVLMAGYDDSKKYWDANGDFVCDLDVMLKYNQQGWNTFLNNKAQFVAVSTDGTVTGQLPYSSVDLNAIFNGQGPS